MSGGSTRYRVDITHYFAPPRVRGWGDTRSTIVAYLHLVLISENNIYMEVKYD